MTASLWIECFLSDPRKTEVFRADTQIAAQLVLYTHLLHCATQAFTCLTRRQSVQWLVNPLYNTQLAQQLRDLHRDDKGLSSDFLTMRKLCLGPTRAVLLTS